MHNNADGLSRSHTAATKDTPPPEHTAIDCAELPGHDPDALVAALEAFEASPHIDGDPPTTFLTTAHAPSDLGPRQLLLEAAPCHTCGKDIAKESASSLVCDRCNKPFHLACTSLTAVPRTYWYCQ